MADLRWLGVALAALAIQFAANCQLARGEPASRYFVAQGIKIHYLVEGSGPAVVLIHGLHSSASVNWRLTGVFDLLAKDHRTIALDLPGHGQSDKPEDEKAYGIAVVEDVVALLDRFKIKRAHIVGYSLGGMVALKFLAMHGDRVQSAVIGGMGWLREGGRLQRFWEQMPVREGARTPLAFVRNIGKLAVTEQDIKGIDVPVQILVGDRDPVQRLYVAPLRLVRTDWQVVEIEDAGHITCIAKPQFRRQIAEWVRLHDRP